MNRFTRNNLLLIVIIACSCVAAILLLVFSIVRYVGMTKCMAEIESIKKQVEQLSRKNPSPHDINRKPIEENTALYNKVADKLAVYFTPSMKALAEEFVKNLEPVKPEKDEDGKIIPMTLDKFRKDYEDMWNKGQSYVDKQYNYNNFKELTFKNWTPLVRKFLPRAQKLTTEPLTEDSLPEVLFSYIGIPRVMGEQPDNMVKFMKNYQNALVKLMTSIKFNTVDSRIDWFGFDPDPTSPVIAGRFNSPRDQYPQIAKVWEIYGDVVKRMADCKMIVSYKDSTGKKINVPHTKEVIDRLELDKIPYTTYDDKVDSFYGLELRAAMGPNARSNVETLRNAVAGNDEGPFKVYRLRISIGGSMAGIRTFIKALDAAYLEKHVYVVKSIALYAERDGAFEIFRSREEQLNPDAAKKASGEQNVSQGRGRGRGRGRSAAAPEQTERQSALDPAVVEEMKRRNEEALKKLKFFERPGYGDILIGDDKTSKAVIDFDCYELK